MGNKKKIVILIFLILILGGVVWSFVLGKPSFKEVNVEFPSGALKKISTMGEHTKPEDLTIMVQQTSDSLAALLEREKGIASFTYRSLGRRDPMVPLVSKKVAGEKTDIPKMLLTGIVWDKYYPLAIINDQVVRKGDVVDGVKIVGIKPDRVVVFHKSKQVIKLHGQEAGVIKER